VPSDRPSSDPPSSDSLPSDSLPSDSRSSDSLPPDPPSSDPPSSDPPSSDPPSSDPPTSNPSSSHPPTSHPPSSDAPGRRLHPLTLVFEAAGVARQMIVPALVGGVSVGRGDVDAALAVGLLLFSVPPLLAAAVRYAFFRWRLDPSDLVIRSGVLSRKHRVIPLARVQNVELRQSALQRLFGVGELRVETAGSGGSPEAVLSVLGTAEARALRAEVLARRPGALSAAAEAELSPALAAGHAAVPPLVEIRRTDLVLAGATANEAGVIAVALAGAAQLLDDLPLPWLERFGDPFAWLERVAGPRTLPLVALAAALVLVVLMVGWLASIAGAVVRYHGFTLSRAGGELRKRYGLLTVHEASVPLERVQAVRIEESLLRRSLGLASLRIETAGAAPGQAGGSGGAEAFVPIAHRGEVARLVRGVFDDFDFDRVALRPVAPKSRRRAMRRYALVLGVPALLFAAAAVRAGEPGWLVALLPVLPLPTLLARWEYLNRGYALVSGYVVARAGVLNRVTWIVPDAKLQTVHLTESFFQRRHGLASVVVDTAAGGRAPAVVVDLSAERARALLDELAGRVHSARALARRRALWSVT
jgi:putative membrane protein